MRRLTIGGIAGVALAAAAASPASANDVWMWACHGPAGQGLIGPPLVSGTANDGALAASGDACAGIAGGLTESFTAADPAAASAAVIGVDVPPGLQLSGVALTRATHGFTGERVPGDLQRYSVTTSRQTLEAVSLDDATPADLSGDTILPVTDTPGSGDVVRVGLRCEQPSGRCAAAPVAVSAEVTRIGLHVVDSGRPGGAVSDHTPAAGPLGLSVDGTDAGTGLWKADVLLDGALVDSASFGGADCRDLSEGGAIDLPLGEDCPHVATTRLSVKTADFGDGDHAMLVRVYDAAGNFWERASRLTIDNHADRGVPSRTLTIGTVVPAGQGGSSGGGGGVLGASAASCRSPKLTMLLDQRPLRISRGVLVVKAGRAYRFRGRLTCVIGGRRAGAPKRTRIDLLNVVGKRTVTKSGTTTRTRGRATLLLRYWTSRTLVFRFVNGDGRRTEVRISMKVARK